MITNTTHWKTISTEEFIKSLGKQKPKQNRPHNFSGVLRSYSKPYCVRCGLIALNNKATQQAIKQGC